MFKFIFLLYYLIDVIFAIEVSPQLGDFSLILLNTKFLIFELLFEFDNALILLHLSSRLFLLLPFAFLLDDFIHFAGEFLELSLEFDVLLDEFCLAAQTSTYAPFSAISYHLIIQKYNLSHYHYLLTYHQLFNMQSVKEDCVLQLKQQPSKLNQITETLLKQAATAHHPHNKLLPAQFVQQLFQDYHPDAVAANNVAALKLVLAANALRSILAANFQHLSENKLYAAIVMIYTQCLAKLVDAERAQNQEDSINSLRFLARGYLLNEIMLKLVQKSHHFVPEYFRFVRISIELATVALQTIDGEVGEKEYKKMGQVAEGSHIAKQMYSLGFKKQWNKTQLLTFAHSLSDQFQRYVLTCGLTNMTIEMPLYKDIEQLFEQFKTSLNSNEQTLFNLTKVEIEKKENEPLFLEEPIAVRELTPRFYDEQKAVQISKLRRKKNKLTKKMELDLRKSVMVKQQEAQVRQDVRRERGQRQQKKEMLIIEKQTVEAKKAHKQMKKVKMISKGEKDAKDKKDRSKKGNMGFKGFINKTKGKK